MATQSGCHHTVSVLILLCCCVLPSGVLASQSEAFARLDKQRADAVRRWDDECSKDYLQDPIFTADPDRGDVVRYVCGGVKDHEERWMCQKRGARMSELMHMYKGVGRRNTDAIMRGYSKKDNSGMRVFIVNGTIHSVEPINGFEDQDNYYRMQAGTFLMDGIRAGILRADMTFDFVMLFTDVGDCRDGDGDESTVAKPPPQYPAFPVVRQSYPASGCPHHVPLTFLSRIQSQHFTAPPTDAEMVPLNQTLPSAVWRGTDYNEARRQLSFLSMAKLVPGLNARIAGSPKYTPPPAYQPANSYALCKKFMLRDSKAAAAAAKVIRSWDVEPEAVCNSAGYSNRYHSVYGKPMPFEEMSGSRYALGVDGIGSIQRLPILLAGSSLVLGMQLGWADYYQADLVPFYHYVPVSGDVEDMQQNLTDTLAWLEANPDTAQQIAAEGRRWVLRHKTPAADHRQWKLYLHLLHDRWERHGRGGVEPPPPGPPMKIDCRYPMNEIDALVRECTTRYADQSHWVYAYTHACLSPKGVGTESTLFDVGDALKPELRPASVLRGIRTARLAGSSPPSEAAREQCRAHSPPTFIPSFKPKPVKPIAPLVLAAALAVLAAWCKLATPWVGFRGTLVAWLR